MKIGDVECDFPPKLTFKTKDIQDNEVSQKDVNMLYPKDWSQEQAEERLFALGHPRFNSHFGLVLVQTFWIREHNNICDMLIKNHSDWDDERIFQTARIICLGELTKYVIEDYIKHIAGDVGIRFDPTIIHDSPFQFHNRAHYEFNYLYRWHSMVPDSLTLNGKEVSYKDLQWAPNLVTKFGCKALLEHASEIKMPRLGLHNTPDFLRNLEVTTLLHSRVLKTESYNAYREFFGYAKAKDFSDITKDKLLQEELKNIYENVDNVDYYVGLMAEDHIGNGMTGELMQTQLSFYAFSALYSNKLFSKENWTEEVFTKEGMERIKNTRLSDFLNTNLQETGGRVTINKSRNPKYDCFKPRKVDKEIKDVKDTPYKMTTQNLKKRNDVIEEQKKLFPIYNKYTPIHVDETNVAFSYIVKTALQSHSLIIAKKQLEQVFKIFTASKNSQSVVQTFATQLQIVNSILGSPSPIITTDECKKIIQALDHFKTQRESDDLIDKIYGTISKYFSSARNIEHLKNCNWNKDELFADIYLNGIDPTQLRKFNESQLAKEFANFTSVSSYFKKKFNKDFVEEIKYGNVYFIDNYETMNLITTDPSNIARPRGLFYYDKLSKKLLPIGIQLNNKLRTNMKVTIISGKNLEKMDKFGLSDPFIEFSCGKIQRKTKVQWNTLNPKWNESFDIQCDSQDSIQFRLLDSDAFSNQFMDGFKVKVDQLLGGKNELTITLKNGGSILISIEKKDNKKLVEDRVYTPADNNWTIAKLFFTNAYIIHHEFVTHNLKCHNVMEAVSICMHHTLYKGHPIFKLLSPHLYYTEVINALARATLMKEDGTGLVSVLFSVGIDGNKINDHFFNQFNMAEHSFTEIMKSRKVNKNIDNYYFGEDGQKVWDAIYKYVEKVLKYHYKNEDFSQDKELSNFFSMLEAYKLIKKDTVKNFESVNPNINNNSSQTSNKRPKTPTDSLSKDYNSPVDSPTKVDKKKRKSAKEIFSSIPESDLFESLRDHVDFVEEEYKPPQGFLLETLGNIAHFLTTLIFNGSAMHTCLHYSQLNLMSFSPYGPSILNSPPPSFDDKSFGPVQDGYKLSGAQQKILLNYLPTMGQSIMLNSTFDPVVYPTDTPLLSDSYNLFTNEPCLGFFKDFQIDIHKVSNEIKKRNQYIYLSNINRSINL